MMFLLIALSLGAGFMGFMAFPATPAAATTPQPQARVASKPLTDPAADYSLSPAKYIGSVYCYACHQELAIEFSRTVMGKLFLEDPKNDLERKGCEGCHGPGSNHANSGGGVGIGGLVEFRIGRGQSIKAANQACLECHDEAFWQGKTHGLRRLACFDCHTIMQRVTPSSQLSRAVTGSWNTTVTWLEVIALGLLAGIIVGGIRRLWARSKPGG
jgi:hypothetical protein